MRGMSLTHVRRCLPWVTVSLALGACGGQSAPSPEAAGLSTADVSAAHAGAAVAARTGNASVGAASSGRSGELLNPDAETMVLLYHELAGLSPPLDRWVESDPRVTRAPAADKPATRELVRAGLMAALDATRDTGFIRLTLNDHLSEYDPSYGEFTLRALAPSSTVPFRGLQQEVSLRFANGRDAQVWAVPAEQAQAINDSLGYSRNVHLDVLLKISGVQPAPAGGSIAAEVLEYEIRSQRDSRLLGRVKPASQ